MALKPTEMGFELITLRQVAPEGVSWVVGLNENTLPDFQGMGASRTEALRDLADQYHRFAEILKEGT